MTAPLNTAQPEAGSVAGGGGFTPGPWFVGEHEGGRPRYWIVTNLDTWVHRVASVPDYAELPNLGNAHLIAAAPDLFEACTKTLEALESRVHSRDALAALEACRAALAKASPSLPLGRS